eukprot:2704289-Rhodomonas_salina.1
MSSTDVVYGAIHRCARVCCYAGCGTERKYDAMAGTELAIWYYALCGTEIADATMRCGTELAHGGAGCRCCG